MRWLERADWLTPARAGAYTRIFAVLMAAAVAFNAVSVALGQHPGTGAPPDGRPDATDFLAFWTAGRLALTQGAAAAYDLAALARLQHATAYAEPGTVLAFFYPPPFLLVCLPFALLSYLPALAAFVAATGAAMVAGFRRLLPPGAGAWVVFGFPGLLMNASTGQSGFLAAACLAWGAAWLDRAPLLAGAVLGGLVAKPHLALAVPVVLAAAGRWRALAACALSALIILAGTLVLPGPAAWHGFLASLPAIRDALENHAEDWGKLVSAYTLARHLGLGLGGAYAAQAATAALALAIAVRAARGAPKGAGILAPDGAVILAPDGAVILAPDGAGIVALAAACGALLTPHVLDYDLALLGVPLAWTLARATAGAWLPWERAACGMAWLLPIWARVVTAAGIPAAPPLLLALLLVVARRVRRSA